MGKALAEISEQTMEYATLVDALEYAAIHYSDRTAFTDGGQAISYCALNSSANQLANFLSDCGVTNGGRVGVMLPRCLRVPVAVYGVWKSGAAYVPIDPDSPVDILAEILIGCDISILITHEQLVRTISSLVSKKTLNLSGIIGIPEQLFKDGATINPAYQCDSYPWDAVFDYSEIYPTQIADAESLAYIIHTSGSTGRPKGIMHTHASALSFAIHTKIAHQLTTEDVLTCHSALHTDMSTLGLFVAPLIGASAVIIPDSHTRVPASLSLLIENTGITVWYSVPYALIQLLEFGALARRDLRSLRWVLYAGEAISPKKLQQLMEYIPDAQYANLYGPAETNVCTFYTLPPYKNGKDDFGEPASIPIGQSWGEHRVHIIDSEDSLVNDGEVGELIVHSTTMMAGYWMRDDLTESVFLTKNFGTGSLTWYRTGDLVKTGIAGQLQLIGRIDRQVKIRGYRIELDAVELKLSELDGVSEAAAFTVQGKYGESLCAVLVTNNKSLTVETILASIRKKLLPNSIPDFLHIMEFFPRTATGKIDRLALANQFSTQL